MDKFEVYHHVKNIQSIAKDYCGGDKVAQEIGSVADQISTKKYRVAVIGEFKRGKSSLVNCILGTELLPTDILPTTAVVNRIVYGTEAKIEINYKDGRNEVKSVKELSDYATKLDKEKESVAAGVREIVITYPSVFCQNNIELLDTPGLNDDEVMDKTTMDILDKIDTAIVVTKADIAVSETEKKLICNLIEQEDIYNLTFVVTFMDRVMSDDDDDDDDDDGYSRVIKTVENRIKKDTYEMFCKKHENDEALLKKAEKILQNPIILPVSSRFAMQGFTNDNKKLLEKSNFPYLKNKLMEILTANQEKDMLCKAARLSEVSCRDFKEWHNQTSAKLESEIKESTNNLAAFKRYVQTGCPSIQFRLLQAKTLLEKEGVFMNKFTFSSSSLAKHMEKIFMYHLLALDSSDISYDAIRKRIASLNLQNNETMSSRIEKIQNQIISNTVEAAFADISSIIKDVEIKEKVWNSIDLATDYFVKTREAQNIPEGDFKKTFAEWKQSTPFPEVNMPKADEYFLNKCFLHTLNDSVIDIARFVHSEFLNIMSKFMVAYQDEIESYLSTWRSLVLKQDKYDRIKISEIAAECEIQLKHNNELKEKITSNYDLNIEKLAYHSKELLKIMNNI